MSDMAPNRFVFLQTPFSNREIVTRTYYHHRTKVKIEVNVAGVPIRAILVVVLRYSLVTFRALGLFCYTDPSQRLYMVVERMLGQTRS